MHEELLSDPLLKSVPVLKGYKLLEPCILLGKVGEGGMGVVYRGRHANLDVEVAVKCLLTPGAAKSARAEETIRRFQREARLAAKISHQNVVRVYDAYQRHGVHYLVMEYVRGDTVREWVARRKPLPPTEAMTVMLGAARGIAAVHQRGIVHRDINPNNILISIEGEVKVADLGLGGSQEAVDPSDTPFCITQPGAVVGTPIYMPPEQWTGLGNVGPEGDIWALGATLYFLIAGESPFRSPNVQDLMLQICTRPFPDVRKRVPSCPAKLAAIVQRCTETDAKRRASAAELVDMLEELERKQSIECRLEDPRTGLGTTRGRLPAPMPTGLLRDAKAFFESAVRGDGMWAPKTERLDFDNFAPPPEEPRPPPEEAAAEAGGEPVVPDRRATLRRRRAARRTASRRWWMTAAAALSIVLIAVVILAAWEPILAWYRSRAVSQLVAGAASLIGEEKFGEAEIALEEALRLQPGDEQALVKMGETLRRQIDALRGTSQLGAAYAKAKKLEDLGGDAKTAIEELKKAIEEGMRIIVDSPDPGSTQPISDKKIEVAGKVYAGVPVRLFLQREVQREELFPNGPTFSRAVDGLDEGLNTLVLRAEHTASGVFIVRTITVWVDTKVPEIEITSPDEGEDMQPPFTVRGRARDRSSITLRLDVNRRLGKEQSLVGNNTEEWRDWQAEIPADESGPLTFRITARDQAGNEAASLERRVIKDPRLPQAIPPELVKQRENAQGYFEYTHEPSGIVLVYLPGGSFTMGASADDADAEKSEQPAHPVELSGFFIAKHEVSRAQWIKVMKALPKDLRPGGSDELPVSRVSWEDCLSFCEATKLLVLPTEAQWEFACRATTATKFAFGDALSPEQAKFSLDEDARANEPSLVTSGQPNLFGLHNMHGNVYEWCQDVFAEKFYETEAAKAADPINSEGPSPMNRVLRGGSYIDEPKDCRSAHRFGDKPTTKQHQNGFRPVYSPNRRNEG